MGLAIQQAIHMGEGRTRLHDAIPGKISTRWKTTVKPERDKERVAYRIEVWKAAVRDMHLP